MTANVRDCDTCRLATTDPGDPETGIPSARVCSWTGQLCGEAEGAPKVCDCPRFGDISGAPCPVCASQGIDTALRHDAEYNLYACPVCPEAWYFGQRELFKAYRGLVDEFRSQSLGDQNARDLARLDPVGQVLAAPEDFQAALTAGTPPGSLVDTGGVQNGGGAA